MRPAALWLRFLRCTSLALALLAATGWHSAAWAHPHGVMTCGLSAHFENGRLALLGARLMMDAQHSAQSLTSVRDPLTGQIDARLQQRLLFLLKTQMARANWLLAVESENQAATLEAAGDARLVFSDDGRLGVEVALRLQPDASGPPGAAWNFSCHDPSYYWVTEMETAPTPLKVTGCAQPRLSPAVKVATGARAGSVNAQVRCLP